MAEHPPPEEDEEEEPTSKEGWKAWVRDIAIAVLIMVVILGAIYAYTGIWPPLVVVESGSMQHSDTTSYIGVIDTGDLVFVQAAPTRADIITYVQGRATGYTTYGDYGDVIIFHQYYRPQETPIIHRAIMYAIPNGTDYADVPDLAQLPVQDWMGIGTGGVTTHVPYHLQAVRINDMGYKHLNITFEFAQIAPYMSRGPGYVTMGDHNAPDYDTGWFPIQSDIIGRARGEIPWFGLVKLLLSPAGNCAQGWGDPCAPANSWNDLAISIVFLVSLPFIVEAAGWAWSKYAWPWLKPRVTRKGKGGTGREGEDEAPEPEAVTEDEDAPKEGSSGP